VEAFTDAVRLRALGLGARVIDVLDCEIQLVLVPFGVAAELAAAVSSAGKALEFCLRAHNTRPGFGAHAIHLPPEQRNDSRRRDSGFSVLLTDGHVRRRKGSRGSDPPAPRPNKGLATLDRTFGERPRASRIVQALGLDQPSA
jgi:hypothetical protein